MTSSYDKIENVSLSPSAEDTFEQDLEDMLRNGSLLEDDCQNILEGSSSGSRNRNDNNAAASSMPKSVSMPLNSAVERGSFLSFLRQHMHVCRSLSVLE